MGTGASSSSPTTVMFKTVSTAPSIPGREQGYGYEEDQTGRLVRLKPEDSGHTGKGEETPELLSKGIVGTGETEQRKRIVPMVQTMVRTGTRWGPAAMTGM